MRRYLLKHGQAARETDFTEADFATSIHQFIKGMNDFRSIGLVKGGAPDILSGAIGFVTSVMIAKPGANYLERELDLGISDLKDRDKSSSSMSNSNILSAFSSRVSSKVTTAFSNFNSFIKFSEAMLQDQGIKADTNIVSKYKQLKHLILRAGSKDKGVSINLPDGSTASLKTLLSQLIEDLSLSLNKISELSGADFSILKQFLNLSPIVGTKLEVDIDTLSEKKYDLDKLPQNLVQVLSKVLREIKNLEYLVQICSEISSNYSSSSVIIPGSNRSQGPSSQNQSPTPQLTSAAATIVSIIPGNNFAQDTPSSFKIVNLTGSSSPSISIGVTGNFKNQSQTVTAHGLFLALNGNRSISIIDPATLNSPTQELLTAINSIRQILSNQNSSDVRLSIKTDAKISGYILTIIISNKIAKELIKHPNIPIISFRVNNMIYNVKTAFHKYEYESNFSKISFNVSDLINNSSNISKIDRQKILSKLKNE